MKACRACSRPLADEAKQCPSCGAVVDSTEYAATISTPPRAAHQSIESRFLPGTVLDRRYRIVAPLGRGGMGEVYRADDIKLGQAVALKFLPRGLERDRERLSLLLEEVKLARQVSHPNVCRVWDAGESEGLHFIAMEYVDGEDLGSLLRRIGRLPEDRAVQVAREICAGLAAVHDQGLLHRDLKPANVMLDGRGRVRITDFGIAAVAGESDDMEVRAGTPAYMAPEQREGREVSVRSDVYSLGLILYEIFTGRHAFDGADPSTRGSDSRPPTPSSHLRTLDPIVERAILRCLEPDPAQRPASPLAVAKSLPGGDPLAAALAAGETPSPEMVAAAGGVGGLHPAIAAGIAILAFAGIIGALVLSERRGMPLGPEDKPYAALRDRASEFARAVGAATPADDLRDGYSMTTKTPGDSTRGSAGRFYYWQRRSPAALMDVIEERSPESTHAFTIPALEVPGESAQRWAPDGRLLEFRRIPRSSDFAPMTTNGDYQPFFAAAGLAGAARVVAVPRWIVPVPARSDSAWTVETSSGPRHVEAASYAGQATFFAVGQPEVLKVLSLAELRLSTLGSLIGPLILVIAAFLARRNVRLGRADTRGAIRVGLFIFITGGLGYDVLSRPAGPATGMIAAVSFGFGLFYFACGIAGYLAFEPMVRRKRPEWLAAWSRLLEGNWLDPLVGRNVLIGVLGGTLMALVAGIRGIVSGTPPRGDIEAAAVGGWTAVALVLRSVDSGVLISVLFVLVLVVMQIITRRDALGWMLFVPIAVLLWGRPVLATLWEPVLIVVGFALLLTRVGLTAAAVAMSVLFMFYEECHTFHLNAWYAAVTQTCLLAVAAIVAWGLVAATRGRRTVPAGPRR